MSNKQDKSDSDISLTVNLTVGNGATDEGTGRKLTDCGLNILNEVQITSTNTIHDLKHYIETKKNPNTIRKTDQCIRRFLSFLHDKKESRNIENIPVMQLDALVGEFILTLKKADGTDYEPDTLTSYHRAIDRYLQDKDYPHSLVESKDFKMSRDVLSAKRKELKQKGLGNRPKRADPLSDEDEEKLWETGQLGDHNPQALLNTVWYLNTKLFGFRGSDESRHLKWDDITLKTDPNGDEELHFNERTTKTRDGNSSHSRAFIPKQFENKEKPERCPVRIYKRYSDQRPESTKMPGSPYYLAINHQRAPQGLWYKCQPLGVNKLNTIMPRMAQEAKLVGHFTNHSVRKTMCTQLLHAGVTPNTIAQLSGHKNVASVNNYAIASKDMQKDMCKILCNTNDRSNAALVPYPNHSKRQVDWENVESPRHISAPGRNSGVFGLFSGANIGGGNFTFNINTGMMQDYCQNPHSEKRPKTIED